MSLRAQRWKQIIIECNSSGMKKADWMRLHGVSDKSFYRWQTALRDQILKELEERQKGVLKQEDNFSASQCQNPNDKFADITTLITQKDGSFGNGISNAPAGQISSEIMIQVGQYHLFIGSNVSESTLGTVLRVIGHA